MEDLLNEFMKLSIPGILFTIVLIVLRLRPVTLLTSNPIERKIFTKEKNFLIKAIKIVFEIVITIIILLTMTILFKESRLNSDLFLFIWATLLFLFIITMMFFLEIKNKNFFSLFQNMKYKYKIPLLIVMLIFSFSLYLLPAYSVGTQFYSEVFAKDISLSEAVVHVVAMIIVYFFITILILMPISRVVLKFFNLTELNPSGNENPIYIEIDGEKWYVYYPIDNNFFYLADEQYFSKSTKFRFISRDEILKHTFRI